MVIKNISKEKIIIENHLVRPNEQIMINDIKDISKYTEQQYDEDGNRVSYGNSFKVELNEFQGETKTVIINNLWDITLEKNKTYEFEFMINEDVTNVKDEIEDIFKNSTIVGVKETTKTGLEQIQEPMVKQ